MTYKAGRVWKDDFNVQKLIPVFKLKWSALVSFSGLAKLSTSMDMGSWVAETVHGIDMHASFDQLPERLLAADKWLTTMRNPPPLVFSVVGFIGRRPLATMISNCQDIDGNRYDPVLPHLRLFTSKPKEPEVRIAGDRQAVTNPTLHGLRKLIAGRFSPREVELAMALANAEASGNTLTISRQCVTGHLLPTGSAEVTPHGIDGSTGYLPDFVIRDLVAGGVSGFAAKMDEDNKPLPPIWVGMTARVHSAPKTNSAVAVLHAIRNVGEPIKGEAQAHRFAFWKTAGKDEPDHYTVNFGDS